MGGQRIDEGLADLTQAGRFPGAAGEDDLDVRARIGRPHTRQA